MKRKNERMNPDGKTQMEKWYALARTHIAIIAKRERTRERCKNCFKMRFNPERAQYVPRHGCGGCAEIEAFMDVCRDFFAGERKGAQND